LKLIYDELLSDVDFNGFNYVRSYSLVPIIAKISAAPKLTHPKELTAGPMIVSIISAAEVKQFFAPENLSH